MGGDEFGLLMPHCSLDEAYKSVTVLQHVIKDYQIHWKDHVFVLGVSIGLVPFESSVSDLTSLLISADAACYIAKDMGRDRVQSITRMMKTWLNAVVKYNGFPEFIKRSIEITLYFMCSLLCPCKVKVNFTTNF